MAKKNVVKEIDPFLMREAQKYENPVPSREFILSELTAKKKPFKRKALLEHFAITSPELQEAFRRRLKAMVRDGQLLKMPNGYVPILYFDTMVAQLVLSKEGEGIARTLDGKTVLLHGSTLRGYYEGDEIEVQIIQIDEQGKQRGRIVKLLKGVVPRVVGCFTKSDLGYEVVPLDKKFSRNVLITPDNTGEAQDGQIVQVEILREAQRSTYELLGKVIEVLGDFATPGIEVQMALRKFGLPCEWPEGTLQEAEKWGDSVQLSAAAKGSRKDITKFPLVTIDDESAKDFDDAVFCEPKKRGGWRLLVAIADVSHYVKPGTALDKEAYHRGNSTYFPGTVVPMLPEALSNGLCSLKPNVLRFCLVCQMTIDTQGKITRTSFYKAIMRSRARLTYTQVSDMLAGKRALKDHLDCLPSLKALHQLYLALYHQRRMRGAIDFETTETRILFNTEGKIKNIIPQERTVAHRMIEESMLAANVSAAKFIHKNKRSVLYRVHDKPALDKITTLRQFLSECGLDLPGRKQPAAQDFSTLLHKVRDREDKHVIETVLLRSLSQAQYSVHNIGHFGLAYPLYLHFTSPIRRYPDLIVHRVISDILSDKNTASLQLKVLEKLATHCSETERRSDEAARDVQWALKVHHMQHKVGECFHGVISGVTHFGIFVELKGVYVEGMLHVTALGNEYFHYDPTHHRLIGDRSRKAYRLGDSVEVQVVRVDTTTKKIDLLLLGEKQDDNKGKRSRKARKVPSRKKGKR